MAWLRLFISCGKSSSGLIRKIRSGLIATGLSFPPGTLPLCFILLHLTGVKAVNRKYETLGELSVSLDDLKNFRQLESRCPGHPEYRWTSGVETTTGPLGQGVATSVGMALASHWLAARYNKPNFPLLDSTSMRLLATAA